MLFRVERINDIENFSEWHSLVCNINQSDVYFFPEYTWATRFMENEGRAFVALLIQDKKNFIIYPFYKKAIKLISSSSNTNSWYDISSPYGYTGPLIHADDGMAAIFYGKLYEWCNKENIVTEFVRFNPFLKNHIKARMSKFSKIETNSQVIYVTLSKALEDIVGGFSSQHKRNLKIALKSDLTFKKVEDDGSLKKFIRLYYHTMERVGARSYYFFSHEYFKELKNLLKENFHLFAVSYSDRPVAMTICLGYKDKLHYHLGASDTKFLNLKPNNFIFFKIIEWAKTHNFKIFNFGGGVSSQDELFRFKSGFSKETIDFFTGKTVFNREMYNKLNEKYRKIKKLTVNQYYKDSYFPLYRQKILHG